LFVLAANKYVLACDSASAMLRLPMLKRRPPKSDEDLFRESTMTFGEHLEELRVCLFKALIGLIGGIIIGLMIGGDVVKLIQRPLKRALEQYYSAQSIEEAKKEIEALRAQGIAAELTDEQIAHLVEKEGLIAKQMYVDPSELLRRLREARPELFDKVSLPEPTPDRVLTREDLAPLFVWYPREHFEGSKVKSLSAQEAFTIYLKAAVLVGVIVASPWIFYQIWSFVASGLYWHERRFVYMYLPFSIGLFLLGASAAFLVAMERVLTFLFSFNKWMGIDPDPRISEWLSFVLWLPIGFGLGFQLPLVMLFLERIGVFTVANYWSQWRVAVLVIFIMAAILTPPDPYSMCLLALPMSGLYFVGIWLCNWMPRQSGQFKPIEED